MAELYQCGDCILLELGAEKRELLFSVEAALWAADNLEEFAGRALNHRSGYRDREPSIEVDAIQNRNKAQVRLRFGWWCSRLYLSAAHAIDLAKCLRAAAGVAERALAWQEERDPQILLR